MTATTTRLVNPKLAATAITIINDGIRRLRACKTDDVIYCVIEEAFGVCLDKDGRFYFGSPMDAAPAGDVAVKLGANILRNGKGYVARPMLRQVAIELAVAQAQKALKTLQEHASAAS